MGERPEVHKVYVGNLPADATQEEVEELFNEFRISKIYLTSKNESNSFAFLNLASAEDVQKCIDTMDRKRFRDKILRVNMAIQKDKPRGDGDQAESAPRNFQRRDGDRKEGFQKREGFQKKDEETASPTLTTATPPPLKWDAPPPLNWGNPPAMVWDKPPSLQWSEDKATSAQGGAAVSPAPSKKPGEEGSPQERGRPRYRGTPGQVNKNEGSSQGQTPIKTPTSPKEDKVYTTILTNFLFGTTELEIRKYLINDLLLEPISVRMVDNKKAADSSFENPDATSCIVLFDDEIALTRALREVNIHSNLEGRRLVLFELPSLEAVERGEIALPQSAYKRYPRRAEGGGDGIHQPRNYNRYSGGGSGRYDERDGPNHYQGDREERYQGDRGRPTQGGRGGYRGRDRGGRNYPRVE